MLIELFEECGGSTIQLDSFVGGIAEGIEQGGGRDPGYWEFRVGYWIFN